MAQRLLQQEGTRDRILTESAELFASDGYDGVSMRHVARAVGTTPAALYYHFKDKADLYQCVLIHVFGGKYSPLEQLFTSDAPPEERLRRIIRFYFESLVTDELHGRLMLRELLDSDPERLRIIGLDILYHPIQLWSGLIQELHDDPRPLLTAQAIGGLLLGYHSLSAVRRTLPDDDPEYDDLDLVADHIASMILNGIGGHGEAD